MVRSKQIKLVDEYKTVLQIEIEQLEVVKILEVVGVF